MKLKILPKIGRRDESLFLVDEENRIVAAIPSTSPCELAHVFAVAPEMLHAINGAVEQCETCCGVRSDTSKCARCQTFIALISKGTA